MISFTVRMKFRSDDRTRGAELLTALAKASRQETRLRELHSGTRSTRT